MTDQSQSPVQPTVPPADDPQVRHADHAGVMSQVVPQVVTTATDQQQPQVGSTVKERAPLNVADPAELPGGVQSVEELRTPEIPVEVEKYLHEVEDHTGHDAQPVIAEPTAPPTTAPIILQPVVVLPMTEEELKEAKKSSLVNSRRWLAEWTEWVRKKMANEVVFRDAVQ